MYTQAVVMKGPGDLGLDRVDLLPPGDSDLVVAIAHSGVSTGTERLFWSGRMPAFPGMGYPLVPGYEAAGEVVEAGRATGLKPGTHVFVPGAKCYANAYGLFGAAAARIVTPAERVIRIDSGMAAEGALLALAATARHAIAGIGNGLPELIVGHGVVGRLLARLTVAAGAPPPTVWECSDARRAPVSDYEIVSPEDDPRRDYRTIYDASGDASVLDSLIGRLAKGGEIVLAGFYPEGISFAFPPAFLKEARLRVAAEWTPEDLAATAALVESGTLSLAGLISHRARASRAGEAYATAFGDPDCLKMVLDWKDTE